MPTCGKEDKTRARRLEEGGLVQVASPKRFGGILVRTGSAPVPSMSTSVRLEQSRFTDENFAVVIKPTSITKWRTSTCPSATSGASLELRPLESRAVWHFPRMVGYGKDLWQGTHHVLRAVFTYGRACPTRNLEQKWLTLMGQSLWQAHAARLVLL